MVACLLAFKAISSSAEGRSAFQSIYLCVRSSGDQELKSEAKHGGDGKFFTIDAPKWKKHPPLLHCWLTLLRSISSGNLPQVHAVEALAALSLGVLRFVLDGKRYICLNPLAEHMYKLYMWSGRWLNRLVMRTLLCRASL